MGLGGLGCAERPHWVFTRMRASDPDSSASVDGDIVVEQRLSSAWSALPSCRALTTQERNKATAAGLATDLYPLTTADLYQTWPIPFNGSWTVGLRYESGNGGHNTASRFRIISLQGTTVKGGNTFVLRQ